MLSKTAVSLSLPFLWCQKGRADRTSCSGPYARIWRRFWHICMMKEPHQCSILRLFFPQTDFFSGLEAQPLPSLFPFDLRYHDSWWLAAAKCSYQTPSNHLARFSCQPFGLQTSDQKWWRAKVCHLFIHLFTFFLTFSSVTGFIFYGVCIFLIKIKGIFIWLFICLFIYFQKQFRLPKRHR